MDNFEKPSESRQDTEEELETLVKGMVCDVDSLSLEELRTVQSKLSINIDGEMDSDLPDEKKIKNGLKGIIEATKNMSEAERIVAAIRLAKERAVDKESSL